MVNGNVNLNAVDVSRPVQLTWLVETPPTTLTLCGGGIQQTLAVQNAPGQVLDLSAFPARTTVTATLHCETQQVTQQFVTASDALARAPWITRLDDPTMREFAFYENRPNMVFSREFDAADADQVFLDIVGLGYYRCLINGQPVSPAELNTDLTTYRKRVYFDTYQIQALLQPTHNLITVELGNGWFNPAPLRMNMKYNVRDRMSIGFPCLVANLEFYRAGQLIDRLTTDRTWRVTDGARVFDNVFIGERVQVDAARPARIGKVVQIASPTAELVPSRIEKVTVAARVSTYRVVAQDDQHFIVDFGRIVSGFLACDLAAAFAGTVTIDYAERLVAGRLDQVSTIPGIYGRNDSGIDEDRPVMQHDEVTKAASADPYHFENRFTYHSFRYVEFTGIQLTEVAQLTAEIVHTAMRPRTQFSASNPLLEEIWALANTTKLNNIHSYYEDCARERLGYAGDAAILIDSQVYAFESQQMIEKVWDDFLLEQHEAGGVTQTAPYMGIKSNGPSDKAGAWGWQKVFTAIPLARARYYGQTQMTPTEAQAFKRFAKYVLAFDYDYAKHCCLGDWAAISAVFVGGVHGRSVPPDQDFECAVMFYLNLRDIRRVFQVYGLEDADLLQALDEKLRTVKAAINDEFYHGKGVYGTGSQSASAYALFADMAPTEARAAVATQFITQITQTGYLDSGIWGMKMSYALLYQLGRDDLVYQWLTRRLQPSFYSMAALGNQTMNEFFDLENGSFNHAMFSAYTQWMTERLLGLTLVDAKTLRFAPYLGHGEAAIAGQLGDLATVRLTKTPTGYVVALTWQPTVTLQIDQAALAAQGYQVAVDKAATRAEVTLTAVKNA
ncbi:family 78 glycoside hydrolase catalytic domain [Lacticaseibacillus daqingensis]|uniref:family 78 glycoside hydrolase catalytic domain n=1 Tax=Lacticaseibacillus daqingensis TaxID=2486014 RepID=UPI0013DDEBE1|nr:family 78 glycoside hydrolase catalytic domain [Lacticaseibacillus daqingensis]